MITFHKTIQGISNNYVEGFCLDADFDNLPTDVMNGSKMTVLASSGTYEAYFDEENGEWVDATSSGSTSDDGNATVS